MRLAWPLGPLGALLLVSSCRAVPILSPPPIPPPSPVSARDSIVSVSLLLDRDFPDPSIVQDSDGTWYAFGTASGGTNIQAAQAPSPDGPWTHLDQDFLPDTGAWTSGRNSWAPDVRVIGPGRYVMYYSGELGNDTAFHCVGVAASGSILGPYKPEVTPFACPVEQGGAIDPAGFYDEPTGKRYVLYKIDGNAVGNGGYCGNGIVPFAATPIMLQEVAADDGVTHIGDAVQILDRDQDRDGPLVEAPNLFRVQGGGGDGSDSFVLLYSNHCWDSPGYTVSYATAPSIDGPYAKAGEPGDSLIGTGDWNLTAPGGATVVEREGWMVFHANCLRGRCMFGAKFGVAGTTVIVE